MLSVCSLSSCASQKYAHWYVSSIYKMQMESILLLSECWHPATVPVLDPWLISPCWVCDLLDLLQHSIFLSVGMPLFCILCHVLFRTSYRSCFRRTSLLWHSPDNELSANIILSIVYYVVSKQNKRLIHSKVQLCFKKRMWWFVWQLSSLWLDRNP